MTGPRLGRVLAVWGEVCIYCDDPATTSDHLVPKSRGGRDALANLRPCCFRCNQEKDDRTPAEWLGPYCPAELADLVAGPKVPSKREARAAAKREAGLAKRQADQDAQRAASPRHQRRAARASGIVVFCDSCGYRNPKPKPRCDNCAAGPRP